MRTFYIHPFYCIMDEISVRIKQPSRDVRLFQTCPLWKRNPLSEKQKVSPDKSNAFFIFNPLSGSRLSYCICSPHQCGRWRKLSWLSTSIFIAFIILPRTARMHDSGYKNIVELKNGQSAFVVLWRHTETRTFYLKSIFQQRNRGIKPCKWIFTESFPFPRM